MQVSGHAAKARLRLSRACRSAPQITARPDTLADGRVEVGEVDTAVSAQGGQRADNLRTAAGEAIGLRSQHRCGDPHRDERRSGQRHQSNIACECGCT